MDTTPTYNPDNPDEFFFSLSPSPDILGLPVDAPDEQDFVWDDDEDEDEDEELEEIYIGDIDDLSDDTPLEESDQENLLPEDLLSDYDGDGEDLDDMDEFDDEAVPDDDSDHVDDPAE